MNKKPVTLTTFASGGNIVYQIGQTMINSSNVQVALDEIHVTREEPGLVEFILRGREIENDNKWRLRITHSGSYTIFGRYELMEKSEQ